MKYFQLTYTKKKKNPQNPLRKPITKRRKQFEIQK
jgi:hypothetical protein